MAKHRHGWTIVFLAGLSGRLLGALMAARSGCFAGLPRMAITHQTTFINSLCHVQGERPWDENASAADNWFVAFFTHGEGWHSFHHRFPSDYRNGYFGTLGPGQVGDLTGSKLGLTRNLKRRIADRIVAAEGQQPLQSSFDRTEPGASSLQPRSKLGSAAGCETEPDSVHGRKI